MAKPIPAVEPVTSAFLFVSCKSMVPPFLLAKSRMIHANKLDIALLAFARVILSVSMVVLGRFLAEGVEHPRREQASS